MTRIIAPDEFRSTPWKNGKGHTLELAISDGGTLEEFDWRLSIAQVVEDGPFSNFSGYERNLFLLEGSGLELEHDGETTDSLIRLLDVARFDGGSTTVATLRSGPITDFNLMTRTGKYRVRTETVRERDQVDLAGAKFTFAFSSGHASALAGGQGQRQLPIPAGHLLVLSGGEGAGGHIAGAELIVIELDEVTL